MKVTGFSFIKNAVLYQYPVVEALRSILPLCDEIVVAVGKSDDGTRELVASIDPRVRIIDTEWDEQLKKDGKVLAVETDKAFHAVSSDTDWCFYIQGDEVFHEDSIEAVRNSMARWKDDKRVDGLLFKYRHFYGSYDYTGSSSRWYRREIRVIRNDRSIYSYRDAQGFRKGNDQKLRVKPVDAWIHHYGWVREPEAMQEKTRNFERYWHGDEVAGKIFSGAFDYSRIDALEKFTGSHPQVMNDRIGKTNWKFDFDPSYNRIRFKDRFKNFVERVTGKRPFDYKNYVEI
jgi:hypothetical protein